MDQSQNQSQAQNQTEPQKQRCVACGHENTPVAKYCELCGRPLVVGSGQPEPIPEPVAVGPDVSPAGSNTPMEARYWAIGAHFSALVGGFLGGVPAFVGPLVVWLIRRDVDPYAAKHGRDALNFNLSVITYGLGLIVLTIFTFGIGLLITIPAAIVLGLAWLVLSIMGTIKAANDEPFTYPLSIRFVK